jgi:hypothetical protein
MAVSTVVIELFIHVLQRPMRSGTRLTAFRRLFSCTCRKGALVLHACRAPQTTLWRCQRLSLLIRYPDMHVRRNDVSMNGLIALGLAAMVAHASSNSKSESSAAAVSSGSGRPQSDSTEHLTPSLD